MAAVAGRNIEKNHHEASRIAFCNKIISPQQTVQIYIYIYSMKNVYT